MGIDNTDTIGLILVVDDDAGSRMLVRSVLEGDGHEIVEATDGVDAIASLKRHVPDLVLMDVVSARP